MSDLSTRAITKLKKIRTTKDAWKKFAGNVESLWKLAVFTAKDHAKLWNCGLNVILRLSSALFLVPFTVTATQDGLRSMKVGSNARLGLCYVFNGIIGLRLAHFMSICLDGKFRCYRMDNSPLTQASTSFGCSLASRFMAPI